MQVYTFHFKKHSCGSWFQKVVMLSWNHTKEISNTSIPQNVSYNVLQKVIKTSKKISSEGIILWLTRKTHKDTASLFVF